MTAAGQVGGAAAASFPFLILFPSCLGLMCLPCPHPVTPAPGWPHLPNLDSCSLPLSTCVPPSPFVLLPGGRVPA